MVKTPDELFEMWLKGEVTAGLTRKAFCYKQGIDISDMHWAFCAGVLWSTFNKASNDD